MFGIGRKMLKMVRKVGEKFTPTKIAEKVSTFVTGNTQIADSLTDDEVDAKDMNNEVYKGVEERRETIGNYTLDKDNSNYEYAAYVDHTNKKVKNVYRGTASMTDIISDVGVMVGADRSTTKWKNSTRDYAKTKQKYHAGNGYTHAHTGHSLGGGIARRIGQDNDEKSVTFNSATGFSAEDLAKSKACKMSNNRFVYCKTDTNIKTTGDIVSAMSGSTGKTKVFKSKNGRGILGMHKMSNF